MYTKNFAREIKNQITSVKIIAALAQNFQDETLYHEALEAVSEIQDEYFLPSIFKILSNKCPPYLFGELLKAATSIKSEVFRLQTICAMAECLPEELLLKLLESAKKMKSEAYTTDLIINSAHNLKSKNLYQKVFKILQEIKSEVLYAQSLEKLVEYIPEDLYQEASEAVLMIKNRKARIHIFIKLASRPAFSYMPNNYIFLIWRNQLFLSIKKRQDILEHIGKTVHIIYHLGGKEAIAEAFSAIQDVGRWWR